MKQLSKIKRLKLKDIWAKEASDFTPWLAENIQELGKAIGIELELETKEADVGDFSLDLLAKDLGTNRIVVVENQLIQTDHDHLGKLLTYAAGFDASIVIWVAESIRDEHRQALDWLNQKTDTDTDFFGVVIEVLQIDDSKPAFNFKLVVFPNEWQKSKRSQVTGNISSKGEAYRQFYQLLIDELREKYKFTGARIAQPQNWYAFSSGVSGIAISAVFTGNDKTRIELYIDLHNLEINKTLFDWLYNQKDQIEKECGFSLQWERLDERRASRVSVYRSGTIEATIDELEQIRKWQIDKLLTYKKVFSPLIKLGVKKFNA
jgi:hypothetical protein